MTARDFKVTVLEKNAEPGDQLLLAKVTPHKEKIGWLIEELTHLATQQGVTIEYNIKATKEVIDTYHPYAVIFVTGGEAVSPRIPGVESESVVTVAPILAGEKIYSNKKIAVGGSGRRGWRQQNYCWNKEIPSL